MSVKLTMHVVDGAIAMIINHVSEIDNVFVVTATTIMIDYI